MVPQRSRDTEKIVEAPLPYCGEGGERSEPGEGAGTGLPGCPLTPTLSPIGERVFVLDFSCRGAR